MPVIDELDGDAVTAGIAGDVVHLEADREALFGYIDSYALAEVPTGDNL